MCLKLLQDSCSEAMIRLFVFFLNFLFIIVGVVLACIGIWMEVEYTKIENVTENDFGATPAAVGIVGTLTLLVASLGLWGIIRKSKCLTGTYGACLIIILLIQMAAIIGPIVARDEAESMLIKSANRTIQEWERPKGPIASSWNVIQTKFECCGVENYKNWQNSKKFVEYAKKENATATYPVPDSCCVEKTENCGFEYNEENMIYSEGCIKKIENWFNSHVGAIVATVAGLCVFEIITMILSFWLVRSGYSYEMIA